MTAIEATIPQWTLGDRIRRARTHKGLEQADVAKALGVSRSLVSMWERDLSDPRVGQIREIAALTRIPENWFWGSTSDGESTSLTLLLGGVPEQLPLRFANR